MLKLKKLAKDTQLEVKSRELKRKSLRSTPLEILNKKKRTVEKNKFDNKKKGD